MSFLEADAVRRGDIDRQERYDHTCPQMPDSRQFNMMRRQCQLRQSPGNGCYGFRCSAAVPVMLNNPSVVLSSSHVVSPPFSLARRDPQNRSNRRVCCVSGCNYPYLAKGLCYGHYWEAKRKERAEKCGGKRKVKTCQVSGCNRKHYAKGFCEKHYRTPKQLAEDKVKAGRKCSMPGCDAGHSAKGLCANHYAQVRNLRSRSGEIAGAIIFKDRNWSVYHRLLELADRRGVDLDDLVVGMMDCGNGEVL